MNEIKERPTSIKNLGMVIVVLSAMMIFSNGSGMLMMILFSADNAPIPNDSLFAYYNYIAGTGLTLGFGFLLSSIFLLKLKNWARITMQVLSGVFIVCAWTLMFIMAQSIPETFGVFPYFVALVFTVPFVFLTVFLNRTEIKTHFA